MRRTAVAFLLATLVASGSAIADEPFWNQRPLGYWLNQLRVGDASARTQAARGVMEMATAHGSASVAAAVPLLVPCLDAPDAPLREAAADALGPIGAVADPAGPLLLDGLSGTEGAVRAESAGLLADTAPADARVLPALIASLRDEDRRVRLAAADALGTMGPRAISAAEPLWRMIHDPDEDVRDHALKAIRLIKE